MRRKDGGGVFEASAIASFVGLGLSDGMIGTAWPSLQRSLHVPVADLGLVLLAATAGSVATSAVTGRLLQRVGIGVVLAGAASLSAAGACGIALSPRLWVLLLAAAPLGAASGMIDGGLNTEVGMAGRLRLMNLLHGFYGVGTSIAPLIVTLAILAGSWRPAYGVLVAFDVVIASIWWSGRHHLRATPAPAAPSPGTPLGPGTPPSPGTALGPGTAPSSRAAPSPGSTSVAARSNGDANPPDDRRASRAAVLAGMLVVFLYTGLEVGAGQWEATFCRSELGLSAGRAGLAVFSYWGALTVVRLAIGSRRRPPPAGRIIWTGLGLGALGTAVIWWRPSPLAAVAGFVLLGAALAGVFPALVMVTPSRIGSTRSQHVIAWQIGAAAVGGSGLSALIGLVLDTAGLGTLGAALSALAILTLLANAALARIAPLT